ncbi:MAG: glucosamine-6-phosphate deaminase [Prevotellaceae bacterium]|jgi:glucosamine-6-phosphate deaminase|nr:glucosamine-6-phosphate deaminase [Prevotellaceae bacterium]
MRVIIQDKPEQVAEWAADYIVSKIRAHRQASTAPFVLGLPTGSTPMQTYAELIKRYQAGEVSFADVVTFNMDEYVGLPEDHPESYHSFMWRHFFSRVDIRPEQVHILNGNAPDLAQECVSYEATIKQAGGIRLFLGGVGPDGHLAFNEPFSSLASRTRIKTLTMDTITANARFFDNDVTKVPRRALTVGIATVMDADEVLILATGHNKARAVRHIIEGGYNHAWTASALQTHPHSIIVCDTLAAYELKVGTYRYFRDIEGISAAHDENK